MILIAMLTAIFCRPALSPLSHLTALLQRNVPYNFIILLMFHLLNVMSVSSFLRRLKAHLPLGDNLADARLKHEEKKKRLI
jgi:hypothetical protein